jgi:hypothetical protein
MEINLNFVFFEELQERADDSGAVIRIIIIRESKDANPSLGEGAAGFYPLE